MKFRHVTLQTNCVQEMKKFYTHVLEMPLHTETDTGFTVRVGSTLLTFEETQEEVPFYHFAFNLVAEAFDEMKAKVHAHSPLLDNDGVTEFQSEIWQARQIYFYDPQKNDVEILGMEKSDETSEKWVRVQEVGRPVPNVEEFLTSPEATAWPNEFYWESDTFRFHGDRSGVFVVVKEHRNWFPTERPATIHPVKLEME